MIQVVTPDGTSVFLDPEYVQGVYKALAVRVTAHAALEVLVQTEEGLVWTDVTDADEIGTVQ